MGTYLRGHAFDTGLQGAAQALLVDVPDRTRAQGAVAVGALDDTTVLLPFDETLDVEGLVARDTGEKEVCRLGVVAQRTLLCKLLFQSCCGGCELGVLAAMNPICTCAVTALLSVAIGSLQDGTAPRGCLVLAHAGVRRGHNALHGECWEQERDRM